MEVSFIKNQPHCVDISQRTFLEVYEWCLGDKLLEDQKVTVITERIMKFLHIHACALTTRYTFPIMWINPTVSYAVQDYVASPTEDNLQTVMKRLPYIDKRWNGIVDASTLSSLVDTLETCGVTLDELLQYIEANTPDNKLIVYSTDEKSTAILRYYPFGIDHGVEPYAERCSDVYAEIDVQDASTVTHALCTSKLIQCTPMFSKYQNVIDISM